MDKKLTKKYQVKPFPTAPVNAHIPPQSKLAPEELKAETEREKQVKEEKNKNIGMKNANSTKEKNKLVKE